MMAEAEVKFSGSRSKGSNSKSLRTRSYKRVLKSGTLPLYFKKKYGKKILKALEVIGTDVMLGRPIHWNVLFSVVSAMIIERKTAPDCIKFVRGLFSLFERYQCKNVYIISEVFGVMFSLTTDNYRFMDGYYTETDKLFYEPYGTIIGSNNQDLLWSAARSGNLGLLKLQLKFGMGMMTPCLSLAKVFCYAYIGVLFHLMPHEFDIDRIEDTRMEDTLDWKFSFKSIERLCLVFRMLEIVLAIQLYPEYKEYYIECYKLVFDSIPEAYVTSVEVKSSLEKCLPDTCSRVISKITEDFKKLLPELAKIPQPRSLKHLCRIQLRQSLRENLNLPHGVSSLPLPATLKKYIMLHDDGDYSVIIRSELDTCLKSMAILWPRPLFVANTPEEDDYITSFLTKL